MIQKTTIVIPEKDLQLAFSDKSHTNLEHNYLKQRVAQEQRVQAEQVKLKPPFNLDKKKSSVSFCWSLNH